MEQENQFSFQVALACCSFRPHVLRQLQIEGVMIPLLLTIGLVLQPPAPRSFLRLRQPLGPQARLPLVLARGLGPAANEAGRSAPVVALESKRVRGTVVRRLPPPRPLPVPGVLSEDAVSRVLELVWSDSRMLLRTALQRPYPIVHELVTDRLPLASWFVRYHLDLGARRHFEALERWPPYRQLFPKAAKSLPRELEQVERRLAASRSRLWPTIRTLLLRPATHARIVLAARRQISLANGLHSSRERVMRAPVQMFLLSAGLIRSVDYGLKWGLIEVARRGSLVSASRQQRWRSHLIDRGLGYGVLLMRQVEIIEQSAPWYRPPARARPALVQSAVGSARVPAVRQWVPRRQPGGVALTAAAATSSGSRVKGTVLLPATTGPARNGAPGRAATPSASRSKGLVFLPPPTLPARTGASGRAASLSASKVKGGVVLLPPPTTQPARTKALGRAGLVMMGVGSAWRRLARSSLRDVGTLWSRTVR
jgi:hypothetical protein